MLHCIIKNIPDMNIDIYIDGEKIFEYSTILNQINFDAQIKGGCHYLKIISNRKTENKKVGLKRHNRIRVYKMVYELYFSVIEDSTLELSYILKNFSIENSEILFGTFSCNRKNKIVIIKERVDYGKELLNLVTKKIIYNYCFLMLLSLLTMLNCVVSLCCASANINQGRTMMLLILSSIAVFTIPVKIYLEYIDYKTIVRENTGDGSQGRH